MSLKRNGILVFAGLLFLSLLGLLLLGSCTDENSGKLRVVTTTSLIAQIVERIGADRVSVVNIIPPAQCPGHFDVKPGDIQKLADGRLFLMHNWQGEKFSDDLIASANNKDLITVKIELEGNWMTPPVQREATDRIASALSQVDPENAAAYEKAAQDYKAKISAKEAEIKARLSQLDLASVKVLCDQQQAGFVRWVGLNIVATYGRPETFTPQVVRELVDKGREAGVVLVIDNMQTGGEAGRSLAEELGVKHIVLSN
ncbi:MAG: metal ABC transporter substrate-binding protein, partial [Dehalococcoidales bacterium]|nr:metal ABC transporter substrate-binding protein [Dehalococcoidales bacterium]